MPLSGDAADLEKAMRSVRIDPVLAKVIPEMSKTVMRAAKLNQATQVASYARKHAKIGMGRGKGGRFSGGVEISGGLAVVAEYGMFGKKWSNWHGGWVQRSSVPPPRFGPGRPKPEDGHIIGKAYKMMRNDLHEYAADQVWDAYQIQFDKKKIFKVRG